MSDDQSPATMPERAPDNGSTGEARVDEATRVLGELDTLPVSEHVERYAHAHAKLQDILNEAGSPASRVD